MCTSIFMRESVKEMSEDIKLLFAAAGLSQFSHGSTVPANEYLTFLCCTLKVLFPKFNIFFRFKF